MRALLDTHAWLWWLFEPNRLSSSARGVLEDSAQHCLFSAASAWELTIKHQLGKLALPRGLAEVFGQLETQSIGWLEISREHCLRFSTLPLHRRDPFDRMLAAQAVHENLLEISRDPWLDHYGLHRLW